MPSRDCYGVVVPDRNPHLLSTSQRSLLLPMAGILSSSFHGGPVVDYYTTSTIKQGRTNAAISPPLLKHLSPKPGACQVMQGIAGGRLGQRLTAVGGGAASSSVSRRGSTMASPRQLSGSGDKEPLTPPTHTLSVSLQTQLHLPPAIQDLLCSYFQFPREIRMQHRSSSSSSSLM